MFVFVAWNLIVYIDLSNTGICPADLKVKLSLDVIACSFQFSSVQFIIYLEFRTTTSTTSTTTSKYKMQW